MDPDAAALIAARPSLRADALDGLLFEKIPLAAIAAAHGTPTWVYGAATLRRRFRRLRAAFPATAIQYAVKANDHLAVLRLLAGLGAGADVVSEGEISRALAAGIAPEKIVFSGVGKTAAEIALALGRGIGQFNAESAEEVHEIAAIATRAGRPARVALRVNPDIDAGTHDKIATGRAGDKFGIAWDAVPALYAAMAAMPGIEPAGLAVHIGSQIRAMAAFAAAYARLAALARTLLAAGLPVPAVDCGGGLGIAYAGEADVLPEAWAGAIAAAFAGLGLRLAIEPGRWLVGPAGLLLASVIRTKRHAHATPIVILDAAMNDLARPAIYGAWHGIVPVAARDLAAPVAPADVAGPVCESSDMFGRARALPALAPGAKVAILDAGAYGAVMSSTYNARPLAAQVLADAEGASGPGFTLIRPRQTEDSLWQNERVPAAPVPAVAA